eukprot:g865.t1
MWSEITRRHYDRSGGRYASDVRDAEWRLIAPLLPARRWTGRPRTTDLREVVNALFYMVSTGCQWRMLPRDFPPMSTVQGYFYAWRDNGVWEEINARLVAWDRARCGRSSPSSGVIDSQSVPTTESGGVRGLDPFKRIKGRKRHIVTDTDGRLLNLRVHAANVQDVHGAAPLLIDTSKRFGKLRHVFADRVYRGPQLKRRLHSSGVPNARRWRVEIVQRPAGQKGFQLLPRRWVVERSFAWFGRRRRLSKDFEKTIASAESWLLMASILKLTRRLAKT